MEHTPRGRSGACRGICHRRQHQARRRACRHRMAAARGLPHRASAPRRGLDIHTPRHRPPTHIFRQLARPRKGHQQAQRPRAVEHTDRRPALLAPRTGRKEPLHTRIGRASGICFGAQRTHTLHSTRPRTLCCRRRCPQRDFISRRIPLFRSRGYTHRADSMAI